MTKKKGMKHHRKIRHLSVLIAADLAAVILQVVPALAALQSLSNGPWVFPPKKESLSAISDYDRPVATVQNTEHSSESDISRSHLVCLGFFISFTKLYRY